MQENIKGVKGMYISPNGMIFNSYDESLDYCARMIQAEMDNFCNKTMLIKTICPNCKEECFCKGEKTIICEKCGIFNKGDLEDESED